MTCRMPRFDRHAAAVVAVLGVCVLARGVSAHDEHGSGGPAETGEYSRALELRGSAPSAGDLHGSSIAIGRLPHLIAVGSPGSSRVFLHDRSTGAVVRTITSPNPTPGDGFGSALAAQGQRLLVGAPFDDSAGPDAGAAYLFDLDDPGAPVLPLLNPTPAPLDAFGAAVAFSAGRPLIGAPGDDAAGPDAGAVHLFSQTEVLGQTLTKPPPIGTSDFGRSLLGLRGSAELIVVGDPADGGDAPGSGAVFVFENDGTLRYRLAHPDATARAGFGAALAGAGTPRRLVVAAPAVGAIPALPGRVDVFDLDSGSHERALASGTPSAGDEFGRALVGLGALVLAGAPKDDTGAADAGAAHLFDATTGVLLRTLPNPTPATQDYFGFAAAASCNAFAVGAPRDRAAGGAVTGAAHLYLPTLAACSVSGAPDQVGAWGPVVSTPAIATHSAVMGNGKVLFWRGSSTPALSYVFDPATETIAQHGTTSNAIFCNGFATLADGRVISVGGGALDGIPDTYAFDPEQEEWTRLRDMHQPRWYPTATTLGDGRVLATGGHVVLGVEADVPEIYDVATDTWTQLASARLDAIGYYPFLFLLPNGKLFQAGHQRSTTETRTLSLVTKTWTDVGASLSSFGTAVMYRPGRVLKTGGFASGTVSNRAGRIDMNAASPAWVETAPMASPRQEHNLVMLPDGTVLAVGGRIASNTAPAAVPASEVWDPATETWTPLACAAEPRMYHSTALLLPDGRVLAAGGDCYPSYQIYSPPYLFRGPRPTIAAAPASVEIAKRFSVQTPQSAAIRSVALLRPAATTHSWDMNQRYVPLTFAFGAPGWLQVYAPATTNVAPPGDYMLVLVDANGVPSTARMLRITGDPPACANALDDDGDGFTDDEQDPGCETFDSDSEVAQCQDGVDNDGDGSIDFDGGASLNGGVPRASPDSYCSEPWIDRETPPLSSCGLGAEIAFALGALAARWRARRRVRAEHVSDTDRAQDPTR